MTKQRSACGGGIGIVVRCWVVPVSCIFLVLGELAGLRLNGTRCVVDIGSANGQTEREVVACGGCWLTARLDPFLHSSNVSLEAR